MFSAQDLSQNLFDGTYEDPFAFMVRRNMSLTSMLWTMEA